MIWRIVLLRLVVCRIGIRTDVVDDDLGIVHIGQVSHLVTVTCLTLAGAKHVAVVLTGRLEGIFTRGGGKVIFMRDLLITDDMFGFIFMPRFVDRIIGIINRISIQVPRTHVVLTGDTDTAALDFDGSDTGLVRIIELVRPAEVEGVTWVDDMSFIILHRFWVNGRRTVQGTHRSHLTAAIHTLLDPTAFNEDSGISVNTACTFQGSGSD